MQVDTRLLVSATEVSKMLGIGRSLFYELHGTGRLGPLPVELNSKKLWAVDELRAWVAAGCPIRDKWNYGK